MKTEQWQLGLVCLALLMTAEQLLPASLLAGERLEQIQQRGTLIWGADQEGGGPYVYPSEQDPSVLVGFEVELAKLIAEHLGVAAQFEQGQWDKLPDLLDRGDVDIVLNGYEWSPIRAERYGTSIPYYIYELQLLGRRDDATLNSFEDLLRPKAGRRRGVSVLGGSAANDYLVEHGGDQLEIVLFEGSTEAMRQVEVRPDELDANLQDLPVWIFSQNDFPGLRPIGPPVGRGYYVALVGKQEPELLTEVNAALLQALQDGRLRRILSKYGLWNPTQAKRGLEVNADGNFVGDDIAAQEQETEPIEQETFTAVRGWDVLWQRSGLLVQASWVTILLSVVSMPLAILVGLTLALMRLYGPWYLRKPATLYVETVRGTPLVLQLYVIFFLLPEIGISIHRFWAAVIGLAINYSAYEAEIYRAGMLAIPKGQMEAALSLGMSKWMALRRIIIPQATRLVIPPVTNDFIALFKDTAVCSVINIVELSKEYAIQSRSTGAVLELGIVTALLYMAMSYPLSIVASRLEHNLNKERQT
ncbi:MAG: ABC transporter permease subunit [Planctomycetaceae bacterium]|nr:ABC transporter permease subunit [Planctomycetaceae bacterium]